MNARRGASTTSLHHKAITFSPPRCQTAAGSDLGAIPAPLRPPSLRPARRRPRQPTLPSKAHGLTSGCRQCRTWPDRALVVDFVTRRVRCGRRDRLHRCRAPRRFDRQMAGLARRKSGLRPVVSTRGWDVVYSLAVKASRTGAVFDAITDRITMSARPLRASRRVQRAALPATRSSPRRLGGAFVAEAAPPVGGTVAAACPLRSAHRGGFGTGRVRSAPCRCPVESS
jgi:hypothetical protein